MVTYLVIEPVLMEDHMIIILAKIVVQIYAPKYVLKAYEKVPRSNVFIIKYDDALMQCVEPTYWQ